jgi:protein ImuA
LRTEWAERRAGALHAPGLADLGLDVDTCIVGLVPDDVVLLRSAVDAARCPALGAVVIECWGAARPLDLTASRRLALAAEKSGVTLLLLRGEAAPAASAAETRWAVHAAPSRALDADAPGQTMFEVELQRRRGGPAGMRWCVEWNRDQACFRDPALSRPVVPLPARRAAGDRAQEQWRLIA